MILETVSEKGGWPPCQPIPSTTPQAYKSGITSAGAGLTTKAAQLAATTSVAIAASATTPSPAPVTTPSPSTPELNPCGNGILTKMSSSCFIEVFGEGVKICEDKSALKRLASGQIFMLEECDDGNRMDGDGCSEMCSLESNSKELVFLSHLLPTGILHNAVGLPHVTSGIGGGEMEGFLLLHKLKAVDGKGQPAGLHPSTGWVMLSYTQSQLRAPSYLKGIYRSVPVYCVRLRVRLCTRVLVHSCERWPHSTICVRFHILRAI
jgi:cysteine-rich repeat protein